MPPPAALQEIQFDENGLLWVLILVLDERWRSVWWATAPPSYRIEARPSDEGNVLWDTILEVIDVERGELVARRRIDAYLRFAGPARVVSYEELDDGTPRITLWRAELAGSRTGRDR